MPGPLSDLMEEIYKNNLAHGWFDESRPFEADVALLHEEVTEAFGEYRNGHSLTEVYGICKGCNQYYRGDIDGRLQLVCTVIVDKDSIMSPCGGYIKPEGVGIELLDVLYRALDSIKRVGLDPDVLYATKHGYNVTRPFKHGGKRL